MNRFLHGERNSKTFPASSLKEEICYLLLDGFRKFCFLDTTEHVALARYIRQGLLGRQADENCSIRSINLRTLSQPASSKERQIYLVVKLQFFFTTDADFCHFQINCYGQKRIQQDIFR